MSRRLKWIAASVLAAVLVGGAAAWHHLSRQGRQSERWLAQFGEVANMVHAELLMEFPRAIRESSGVAASKLNPGVFWTHNDSGHGPVLFAVRPADGFIGKVRLDGAVSQDWEDIATGPCLSDVTRTCLYVGDIGDNMAKRSSVAVLVAEEPLVSGPDGIPGELEWTAVSLNYFGGPRNAEALAISRSGDLLVVARRGTVFRASRKDLEAGQDGRRVVLRPDGALPLAPEPPAYSVGTVSAATVTGADLVVKTYGGIQFFRRAGGDAWSRWEATRRPCWVGHLGPMGEGLDVELPDVLYVTQEKAFGSARPAALHRVACPP